jgi:peptidoglycan L-alanyl-D-glutamate endopeptidase CwlK
VAARHALSRRSKANLVGVHADLVRLAPRALELSPYDFGIASTSVRGLAQQLELIAAGRSKTKNSRHVPENNECGVSCAVDVVIYDGAGVVTWEIGYFRKVAQAWITAAIEQGVQIEPGCLWKSFIDGPHIQLSRRSHP